MFWGYGGFGDLIGSHYKCATCLQVKIVRGKWIWTMADSTLDWHCDECATSMQEMLVVHDGN